MYQRKGKTINRSYRKPALGRTDWHIPPFTTARFSQKTEAVQNNQKSKRTGEVFKLGKDLYKEVYEIVPYESLIKVDLPILFVHGLIDNMVPYELSVKVSKMCKNARLELIENGTHTFDNDINALNKAIDVTIDFIEEKL